MKWREVIEKAGGIDSAMLYGQPLKDLVAELEAQPAKIVRHAEAADKYLSASLEAIRIKNEVTRQLSIEQETVIGLRQQIEDTRGRLERAEKLIEVIRHLRQTEYIEPRIDDALAEYEHGGALAVR